MAAPGRFKFFGSTGWLHPGQCQNDIYLTLGARPELPAAGHQRLIFQSLTPLVVIAYLEQYVPAVGWAVLPMLPNILFFDPVLNPGGVPVPTSPIPLPMIVNANIFGVIPPIPPPANIQGYMLIWTHPFRFTAPLLCYIKHSKRRQGQQYAIPMNPSPAPKIFQEIRENLQINQCRRGRMYRRVRSKGAIAPYFHPGWSITPPNITSSLPLRVNGFEPYRASIGEAAAVSIFPRNLVRECDLTRRHASRPITRARRVAQAHRKLSAHFVKVYSSDIFPAQVLPCQPNHGEECLANSVSTCDALQTRALLRERRIELLLMHLHMPNVGPRQLRLNPSSSSEKKKKCITKKKKKPIKQDKRNASRRKRRQKKRIADLESKVKEAQEELKAAVAQSEAKVHKILKTKREDERGWSARVAEAERLLKDAEYCRVWTNGELKAKTDALSQLRAVLKHTRRQARRHAEGLERVKNRSHSAQHVVLVSSGCKEGKIGDLIHIGRIVGVDLDRAMSRRTVRRAVLEGLVASQVQLEVELKYAEATVPHTARLNTNPTTSTCEFQRRTQTDLFA
ncbi:hypothetical protein R3P38DRAFT_2758894 [Favolaschia claudopus]|uniref:Uncharacterized protein n=1 Tax=Favolaschia claudopus TaxID=2862362 RepID=A0AAW0E225_9AGAR